MNIEILEQYNITFQKVIMFGRAIETIISPSEPLNQLVFETRSEYDLLDTIGALDAVLNQTQSELVFWTEGLLTTKVTPGLTTFYDDPDAVTSGPILFSLPTSDLKEIILSWKEYLEFE